MDEKYQQWASRLAGLAHAASRSLRGLLLSMPARVIHFLARLYPIDDSAFSRWNRLLCTDLDGTMFPLKGTGCAKCMLRFKLLLETNPKVALCYVSGRDLELALEAIRAHSLPVPDFIICDVGTSIYRREESEWALDWGWRAALVEEWPEGTTGRIISLLDGVGGLSPQPAQKQGKFKASFYLRPEHRHRALTAMRQRLRGAGIRHTVTISKGAQSSLLVDLLPPGASKEKAVRKLAADNHIGYSNAVFAGDSGNDYSILASNLKAILVSNAEPVVRREVLKKASKTRTRHLVYAARGRFDCERGQEVCGVLEGALHYKVFSQKRGLRVQMHSIHGLVNGAYSDLGRDEDTGGQVVYVVELAKALGGLPEIEGVDLFTRRIRDRNYPHYSRRVEYLNKKARIVRVPCGPDSYVKKTGLWPFIGEYVAGVLEFNKSDGIRPDVIHGNYADAGLAGAKLAAVTGAIFVFTAHSLARPKMEKMGVNEGNYAEFDREFNFTKRLAAEQAAIDAADAIITSTSEEIDMQYGGYRIDRRKFHVVAPGVDLSQFHPPHGSKAPKEELVSTSLKGLSQPSKPVILAISRLDRRKNVPALVSAFCNSSRLPRMANLVVLTGMKKNAVGEQRQIFSELERIIRKTGRRDSVSLVNFVDARGGLGELYRLVARSRGVFANPALIEPFGLTVLEASACGVPVIATKYGGPSEVITDGENGLLVEPGSQKEIEEAIYRVLSTPMLWDKLSRNAIVNASRFSWRETALKEAEIFEKLAEGRLHRSISPAIGRMSEEGSRRQGSGN
ncbi:MAG: HAD-IIB family hydrolase [Candidatus Micrarchaeia archaeon]